MNARTLKTVLIVTTIIAAGLFLRLRGLNGRPLWYDDITCLAVAEKSAGFILGQYPVYKAAHILLLKGWMQFFGRGPWEVRMLPVAAGVISLWLIYLVGREAAGRRVGIIASFLLAISCFHIYLSREIKQYTVLTAFSLAAVYFLLRFLRQGGRRDLGLSFIFNTIVLFIHPVGAAILMVQAVHVIFARSQIPGERLKTWLRMQEAMLVVFGVWVAVILATRNHLQAVLWWVRPPLVRDLADTFQTFCYGLPKYGLDDIISEGFQPLVRWGLLSVFAVFFLRGALLLLVKYRKAQRGILTVWFFLPLILALVFSRIVFPVYVIKHFLIILPAFYLIVAFGISYQARERAVITLMILILALHIVAWRSMYLAAPAVQWDKAVSLMKEKGIKEQDTIIMATTKENVCLFYFLNNADTSSLKDFGIFGRWSPSGWQDTFFYAGHRIITFGSEIPGVIRPGYQPMRFTGPEFQRKVINLGIRLDRGVWLLVSKWASGQDRRDDFAASSAARLAAAFRLSFEGEAGGIKLYYFEPQRAR